MNWIPLTDISQLDEIDKLSSESDSRVAIFKHSTRCSISSMAKNRLEKASSAIPTYLLDLIRFRDISNEIARRYNVMHESPQLLVIQNAEVIDHSSHNMVNPRQLS